MVVSGDHISLYQLTVEKGTLFSKHVEDGLKMPTNEDLSSMYFAAVDVLSKAGFQQYEVSNFGRNGNRSVHNEGYWKGFDYFGSFQWFSFAFAHVL